MDTNHPKLSGYFSIREGDNKKMRGGVTFNALILPGYFKTFGDNNDLCRIFVEANAENQLVILKRILWDAKESFDSDTVDFLVTTYLLADTKHPTKSMISRYVTKTEVIQELFTEILTSKLKELIKNPHTGYKSYIGTVTKVLNCTENFPVGAQAVKNSEIPLIGYFNDCLTCCVDTLSDDKPVSPTEKNDIFTLTHSALRLLLYLVQKLSTEDISKLSSMFQEIGLNLKSLLFDDDVPMDTKSVCGILYVTIYVMENQPESWVDILHPQPNSSLEDILKNESAQLSLYSALATAIPIEKLSSQLIDDEPAIIILTNNILSIGERTSAESIFILGVTRTVLQLTRALDRLGGLGLRVVEQVFVFVWSHLEHHTDSVQHLTAQALGNVVKYCARLRREGNNEAITKLINTLSSLERNQKNFYICLNALTAELGAGFIMEQWPNIVVELITALGIQAVQASATTALETLLRSHLWRGSSESTQRVWIQPILSHVAARSLDPSQMNVLQNLLILAAKLDENVMDYIIPYVKEACNRDTAQIYADVKCVLMLLSVVRKSGELVRLASDYSGDKWKDIISYDVLKLAAVDAVDENRILSLALIVESPKSTEVFSAGELRFILWFVSYNINAQTPHFRQLVVSMLRKFIKRFENSYKTAVRNDSSPKDSDDKGHYYLLFLEEFRELCFASLVKGANYSRRNVALQVLAWLLKIQLEGYTHPWKEEYAQALLGHLADSYETNKALALEMMFQCPQHVLRARKYSTSLELRDIILEASSVKPTECVTAVYKLKLLMRRRPDSLLGGEEFPKHPESELGEQVKQDYFRFNMIQPGVQYIVLSELVFEARRQVQVCAASVVMGARRAPVYGVLHCISYVASELSPFTIMQYAKQGWMDLIERTIQLCFDANASVAHVLCSAAPEGMIPCDDVDRVTGNVRLEDGSEVTAQMVLLCAWRTVKEASLILSTIVAKVLCSDEFEPAAQLNLVKSIGGEFTKLLTEIKHRGAFEQVYVGFTKLLTSLWRNTVPELNELPKLWFKELMQIIESGDSEGRLCATRRSAGLPFMIQALVITELEVKSNPKCFHECMSTLLRLARTSPSSEARCHCLNVLRALYRCSHLDESVAHAGEGLRVALDGFDGRSWNERNSSTLLFSALMVRVFGVQRTRHHLCTRNRMTGRIFFLRYPNLYDYMLNKLKEISTSDDEQLLRPSLYPILLLLARLYPSSLEGTVSNLKLVSFVPHVVRCGRARVLTSRALSAAAVVPLVAPHRYIPHIEEMLTLICDKNISRNYCHGILLQLIKLFEERPENLNIDKDSSARLVTLLDESLWILQQSAGEVPCYVIADEYIKMINILIKSFNSLIKEEYLDRVQNILHTLLHNKNICNIYPGKDLCLANASYLYLIILNVYQKFDDICQFVYNCLNHKTYEVILTVLNYLLILYDELEVDDKFQEHLKHISNKDVLQHFKKDENYIQVLYKVFTDSKYLECKQKSLKILSLEPDTHRYIINGGFDENITDDTVVDELIQYVENAQENLTHIYLSSLSNFLTKKLKESELKTSKVLEALRVIFACSLSDNSDDTRGVVVQFLVKNLSDLIQLNLDELSEGEQFEFKATLWAITVSVLEDNEEYLRVQTSHAVITTTVNIAKTCNKLESPQIPNAISSRAADFLRDCIEMDRDATAIFSLLALLDFKSEVCATDDINDECRAFDQNERYNVFLEETVWSIACADRIKNSTTTTDLLHHVRGVISDPKYKRTFDKLCGDNVKLFEDILDGVKYENEINPKIQLFIDKLAS